MHSILDLLIKCMYAKDLSQKQENTQLHHLRQQHSLTHTYTSRTIVTNLEGCGKKNTNALSVLHTHGTYPPHPLQHQPSPLSCLQKTQFMQSYELQVQSPKLVCIITTTQPMGITVSSKRSSCFAYIL